ncbi:MAG: RES domain-containing protein [Candidatus Binatia bacterium]
MSRLWRVFPWDPGAESGNRGHPLWIPRTLQGAGRHDNPDLYGAMYLSERPLAAMTEQIAHLRGQRLDDTDLERGGTRLALVPLDGPLEGRLWDLDDPRVLVERRLRPSQVATRVRELTRRQAADLFRARPRRDGLRWWSALEASWIHVTLFDRAVARLSLLAAPEPLHSTHSVVREAAEALGISLR